ncbi:proline--tRNA ligase [Clostridium bowmanii]|uniref:proline--tRNA ligase n=1 Tax=Clostridium bowmanii TaxID=132925 RepID=UPI001C0E222E|nr:proline--tRNA ligase [Clostridium bowmanii]MBU3188626.1 proline--tRNA ligase [Clostridium bowmanii]MCA1073010.1 proline--tRNA ligase [Clostridium bowmanii]
MKLSKMLISTLREVPAEAEIWSHKLMLRAGMIRKTGSGLYTYMPFGIKVIRKIEDIVRCEMEDIDAQEFLASNLLPSETLSESNKCDVLGVEMFRLKDRSGNEFCLAAKHEEAFTDIAINEIKSYKQLPLNLYQVQNNYRDEKSPKFGVMRSREFIMGEACSFDASSEGLDISYNKMQDAYNNVFRRCALECKAVEADSVAIGGTNSVEFMVKSEVGEDEVIFCSSCSYAANMENAPSNPEPTQKEEFKELKKTLTPNVKTIDDLAVFFNTTNKKFAKTLIYKADDKVVAVMVRGDRQLNESKVINAIGGAMKFELADIETVMKSTSAEVGFAGPIGIVSDVLLVDEEVANMYNFMVGANDTGYHYENVNYGKDFKGQVGDYRKAAEGDKCSKCGLQLTIGRSIEVAHIFKLGTKYSKTMGATFMGQDGKNQPLVLGWYGIGINRIMAAVIEKHHDENGIIWPMAVAPYQIVVVPVSIKDEEQMRIAEKIYNDLKQLGIEVLMDDRNERVGVKFKDLDLIGIPMRITVGKKISEGNIEFKLRCAGENEIVEICSVIERVKEEFISNNIKL